MEITRIYLVENCYGDKNKVYIGKNKNNSQTREAPHKKTYGSQIEYTVIDEVNSWDKKVWKPLEQYWVEQFRQWGFDVQNKNKGGGGPSFHTEEMKTKMKEDRKKWDWKEIGNKISQKKKGKGNPKIKGIKQSQERINNRTSKTNWEEYGRLMSKKKKNKPQFNLRKSINQFDKNMNLIREWSGQREAADTLKIDQGSISQCLLNKKGENRTAGGFIWKFKK